MAKVMVGQGVDFLAVSFVRAAADLRKVREAIAPRTVRLVAKIETLGAVDALDRDHRRGRRDHGRPRRPRHRVPAGGRAPPAEADHPPLRRGRRAGDHRHADDGEHDHRPVADAGRGQRRGQRGVRRHRRADAQRRDRDRRRPRRRGRRRWSGWPSGPRSRRATPSGASGSGGRSARSGPTARTGSRWRSPTPPGWPRWTAAPRPSCAAPARGAPPRRWPASDRRRSCSGCRPTRPPCGRWRCRGASPRCRSDTYTSTDELVWFAVETGRARRPRPRRRASCSSSPVRPTGRAGRAPTCCASCRLVSERSLGSVTPRHLHGLFVEEDGDEEAPVVAVVHGSMDRAAGMIRVARRLTRALPGAALRPARLRPLGARGTVRHGRPGRGSPRRARVDGGPCSSGTATAATSCWPPRRATPTWSRPRRSTRRRCRGRRGGRRRRPGRAPSTNRARTAEAGERFMRRMIGDQRWDELPERVRRQRRAEGAALVGELGDLRVNPPWHPDDLRLPVVFGYGTRGAATTNGRWPTAAEMVARRAARRARRLRPRRAAAARRSARRRARRAGAHRRRATVGGDHRRRWA